MKRVALIGVCAGALLVTLAFGSAWLPGGAPVWGTWLMILGSAKLLGSATMLGALNSGVRWPLALAAAVFLSLLIVIGFGAPLLLPVETAASPLVLGLPVRAAIEIYGVGLLPIVVLPWLFAAQFRQDGLDDAGLAALRSRCAAAQALTEP